MSDSPTPDVSLREKAETPEPFPVMDGMARYTIPSWLAEEAYRGYSLRYGTTQSLTRMRERGGFYAEEMDQYAPGWRDRIDYVKQLLSRVERAEADSNLVAEMREALRSCGITRSDEHGDEGEFIEWAVETENGADPVGTLEDAVREFARMVATPDEPQRITQAPNGCWVACIAALTDIPHDALIACIPDTVDYDAKATEYHNAVNRLTRSSGWRLQHFGPDVPKGYAIASGQSPRGLFHAVIVKDGVLWHDPHPSRAGLVSCESYEGIYPLAAKLPTPEAPNAL